MKNREWRKRILALVLALLLMILPVSRQLGVLAKDQDKDAISKLEKDSEEEDQGKKDQDQAPDKKDKKDQDQTTDKMDGKDQEADKKDEKGREETADKKDEKEKNPSADKKDEKTEDGEDGGKDEEESDKSLEDRAKTEEEETKETDKDGQTGTDQEEDAGKQTDEKEEAGMKDASADEEDSSSGSDEVEANKEKKDTEEKKSEDDQGDGQDKEGTNDGKDQSDMEDDQEYPEITEFYIQSSDIYTKDKTKWYAACDKDSGKAHITFFVSCSTRDVASLTIRAVDKGRTREIKTEKTGGRGGGFRGYFDEEGSWEFTAIVTDLAGRTSRRTLSESSETICVIINNDRPELHISYDGTPYKKEDDKDNGSVYYGPGQDKLTITLKDPLASFADGEEYLPKINWTKSSDMDLKEEVDVGDTDYKLSCHLGQEGSCSFRVSYRSKNGNSPDTTDFFSNGQQQSIDDDAYQSRQIIIDHTPPELVSLNVIEGNNKRYSVDGHDCIFLDNSSSEEAWLELTLKEDHPVLSGMAMYSGNRRVELAGDVVGTEGGNTSLRYRFDISCWSHMDEGQYTLKPGEIKDRAGNVLSSTGNPLSLLAALRIVIDRTAPVLSVSYPDPVNMIEDSERLQENSTELFYKEKPLIRIGVQEENYIAGISDDDLSMKVNYKKTDESDTYDLLNELILSFTQEEKGQWTCLTAGLPDQEGHSWFSLSFKDPSGNSAIKKEGGEDFGRIYEKDEGSLYLSPVITLDSTDPVITTSFSKAANSVHAGRSFYQEPLIMTILIRDENFMGEGQGDDYFSLVRSAYDFDPATDDIKEDHPALTWFPGSTWDQGTYHDGIKQYRAELIIDEDWNYNFRADAADLSGNWAVTKTEQLTLDTHIPYISINDKENTKEADVLVQGAADWERVRFFDYQDYGYFHHNKVRVKVTAHDMTAGVRALRYRIIHEDGKSVHGLMTFDSQAGKQTTYINLLVDIKARIVIAPVDFSNWSGKEVNPRGLVTESEAFHKKHSSLEVKIKTTPTRTVGDMQYFNGPVEAEISMNDSHSGIEKYEYEAGKSLSGRKDYGGETGSSDKEGGKGGEITYSCLLHLSLPADKVNYSDKENPTLIRASFSDHAGYENHIRKSLVIDDKKPEISVSWTGLEATPDQIHYRSDRTALIQIKEHNFDESLVSWKIKKNKVVRIGSWKHQGDHHSCRVVFDQDGDDYLLDFDVADLSGNTASCPAQKIFCIDKTAPVISLSYDNNNVKNGRYYNNKRRAVITITEHNFRASDVKCNFKSRSLEGSRDIYSQAAWTGTGDQHKNVVPCVKDGEYSFKIDYTDLAGNHARTRITDSFIIDQTPPLVRIKGVKDGAVYKGTVAPVVEYQDEHLVEESTLIRLSGNKNGRIFNGQTAQTSLSQGKRIRWKDFKRVESVDDIYSLKVVVEDKAGNRNDNTVTVFTVNRFGSSYRLSKETDQLVNGENPYIVDPVPIEITEVNVSSLKEESVSIRNDNNEIIKLREGPDYSLLKKQDKYGWYEYTYQIKKENFANEGRYTVTIASVDQADNQMTNVSKDKQVRFVVDQTKPYGVITGLEEKVYKEDRHEIIIRADDNYALKEAELYVNGIKKKTYAPDDFLYGAGISEYLKQSNTVQRISLKLTDKAGNTRVILPHGNPLGSLITTSRFILMSRHIPLMAFIVLLLMAGLYLIKRFVKRRKNMERYG